MTEIFLVGLGEIAETHIQALEEVPDATLVAGVDIDSDKPLVFRGQQLPVYQNIAEASEVHRVDIAVIATPTPTHYAVSRQALSDIPPPLRVLVEKPGADSLSEVEELLHDVPPDTQLQVMHHYAYAPEVLWASRHLPEWSAKYGAVRSYRAQFDDPRSGPENVYRRKTLSSSWLDLGINALSVAQRLVDIENADSHDLDVRDEYEALLKFEVGNIDGAISTNWHVDRSSYTTELTFASGARLVLGHYAVTGFVEYEDKKVDIFTGDGTPRRLSHYRNLYDDMLGKTLLLST